MTKKKKHQRKEHQDIETAAELTPTGANSGETSREESTEVNGTGIGVTALILSILAFFLYPFILSILGIILGVIGGQKGSAAGWWAVGIGAFVLLIRILAFPIFAIF